MQHTAASAFETQRLICRPFQQGDETDMFDYWAADPDIQIEYGEPVYQTPEQTKALLGKYIKDYDLSGYYRWAIIEKQSGHNIGQIAFCKVFDDVKTAEIEYCISKRCWGKGYAGEALAGLISYAFENTNFDRLEAYHRAENTKSGNVLVKSRMHMTETVERFKRAGEQPTGEVCYCIEREEYQRSKEDNQ
jgi:ribosomal-protein-alanine N-acetyltransferase